MTRRLIEHDGFCIWSYDAPAKTARGFWHGDDFIIKPEWAYALRSSCGTFWRTSEAVSGFATEEAATEAGRDAATKVSA